MVDAAPSQIGLESRKPNRAIFLFLAWRNLWRNKRRTWLAAGAVAFAVFLIQSLMSFQAGTYGPMIDGAARFGGGHMQIQHPQYEDDPRIEHTFELPEGLVDSLAETEGVEIVTLRAETFALLSNEERSEGGLITGVLPGKEKDVSQIAASLIEGSYLDGSDHAFIGAGIARNLDLQVDSELVILGSDKDGAMAATVLIVGGIFETGNAALDRTLVQIPLQKFQETFGLTNEIHRLLIYVDDTGNLPSVYESLQGKVPSQLRLLDWGELMPDVKQGIQLDLVGNAVIYVIMTVIIVLSIANTFVMTMFERTREFGMLMSIGVQTGTLFRMVLIEALLLWVLGVAIGLCISGILIGTLSEVGINVEAMEDIAQQYFIDALYPAFNTTVLVLPPLAIGFGILVSASIAFLRLYRIQVVEALRDEE